MVKVDKGRVPDMGPVTVLNKADAARCMDLLALYGQLTAACQKVLDNPSAVFNLDFVFTG